MDKHDRAAALTAFEAAIGSTSKIRMRAILRVPRLTMLPFLNR
jgi:hypothetical protein